MSKNQPRQNDAAQKAMAAAEQRAADAQQAEQDRIFLEEVARKDRFKNAFLTTRRDTE